MFGSSRVPCNSNSTYPVSVIERTAALADAAPNDWAKEQGDPRSILDLIKRIIRVSLETVAIVKTLPQLPSTGSL